MLKPSIAAAVVVSLALIFPLQAAESARTLSAPKSAAITLQATPLAPPNPRPVARNVPEEIWSQPRSGEAFLHLPAVADTVRDYLRDLDQRILVRHPGTEEGELQASELRGWLVALGINSARIALIPDPKHHETLELRVAPPSR